MLTYERFKAAFSDEEQRDAFFRAAVRTGVPCGTAMTHVLGTNLGIWGDETGLKRDAAEIMALELDGYADAAGEDRLGLPATAVANSQAFSEAFRACRRFNADEIEAMMAGLQARANPGADGGAGKTCAASPKIPAEDDPAIRRYLSEAFVRGLYHSLCKVADQYREENSYHREKLARIGIV